MAPAWRERRAACDVLLDELESALDVDALAPDAPTDVLRRDLLLDLAAGKLGRVQGRAAEALRLVSELRLDAEADFEAVDTLVRGSCSKVLRPRSLLSLTDAGRCRTFGTGAWGSVRAQVGRQVLRQSDARSASSCLHIV